MLHHHTPSCVHPAIGFVLAIVTAAASHAEPSQVMIENEVYRLGLDPATGAITSFFIKPLSCEMIGEPRLAANFRVCLPLEHYQANYIDGMAQKIARIEQNGNSVTVRFSGMTSDKGQYKIDLAYTITLDGDQARFRAKLTNHDSHALSEFWFPRFGGWTQFGPDRMARVAVPGYTGCGHHVSMFKHFPGGMGLGAEAAEWAVNYPGMVMPFWSIKEDSKNKALYLGYHDPTLRLSTWHTYLCPTNSGNSADAFLTPEQAKGQPVGLIFSHVRYPFIHSGESFDSGEFIVRLHDGDWHQAAKFYRQWFTDHWPIDNSQHWLRKQSAWFTSIIYQPEDRIVADFKTYDRWTAEARQFGVNTFELIGWHKGGLERGYPEYVPEEKLGGAAGFQRVIDSIHARGGRVLPFVNYNILDSATDLYKTKLRPYTHQDQFGSTPNWMAWGESTLIARLGLSVRRHLLGSIVPPLEEMLDNYFLEVAKAGADGLQIDKTVVSTALDFNPLNTRKPDEALNQGLVDAIERLYKKCRAVNPDFCLASEALQDRLIPYVDVYYRAAGGGDIAPLRYAFPEWTACIHVGTPRDFNEVNTAVMLGAVLCIEPMTYQTSMAHPLYADLSRYIGETERIRREWRDTIFTADYLDMTEGTVMEVSVTPKPSSRPAEQPAASANAITVSPESAILQGINSGTMFWRTHANRANGRRAIVIINKSAQERYYTWKFTHREVTSARLVEPFKPVRDLDHPSHAVKIAPERFHIILEK